ncbi:fatty acid desaturase [Phenylobacterium sp.]|uniref:fatty acid desaturase n=1 Tax=Phenylobacterium sp. TaxID=1871053 RepID=UPI002732C351|nr:fatty acid desaturase [Phenylobacterium sp.]MDP3853038.1 fatty acid desaturase [Phenylobacterium sp.]
MSDQAVLSALSPADEKACAKALSPAVAWPTLAMAVALPIAQWTIVGLGLARILPLWVCAAVLTFTSYAHYTLVHESIHGNLAPGFAKLRWLNTLVGWVGALGLSFNWPMLMRGHVLHHAHTNTDKDPDIHVKGTLGQLVAKWLVFVPMSLVPPFVLKYVAPAQHREIDKMLMGSEMLQASAVSVSVLVLLAASVPTGHVLDWLFLLFIPSRVAGLILQICFSWLPHHPFDQTERYLNTRISLWSGGTILLLQQNLHLMHHLWPSVPFYNYARLYRRLRPTLIAKGSPIQGLMVGRYAKDLTHA